MSSYGDSMPVAPPAEKSSPKPEKKKREGAKMSEKQKADLKKHMDKMKEDGMGGSELKSHRMKLMSRMRKDPKMTAKKAHKDLMG